MVQSAVMISPSGQFEHELQNSAPVSTRYVEPDKQEIGAEEKGGQKCPAVQSLQFS